MSIELKREYLQILRNRYKNLSKREKTRTLSDFCQDFGYSRKYAIRILNRTVEPLRRKKPGRKPKYGAKEVFHLRRIWMETGWICSKNLASAMKLWLPFYDHPLFTNEIRQKLEKMSPSTIDRLLRQYRCKKGISSTRSAKNLIKNKIPIELLRGKIKSPGFVEADTVAHCGKALLGRFIYSTTVTDLFSGWTENRATWGKDAIEIKKIIKDIEISLPFKIETFASDNGSEFLNEILTQYFWKREKAVKIVRGRPYRKNDNAHVEQKNWTHVRQLFGYGRIDNPLAVSFMNEIYELYWNPFNNFFIPSAKLIEKIRYGGRVVKKYDQPKTPYQRLMESSDIDVNTKRKLQERFESLNPFKLKKDLELIIERFKLLIRKGDFGNWAA